MGPGSSLSCNIRLNSALTEEQKALYQDREGIEKVLNEFRVIAMVGLSADPQKASSFVANYLLNAGYTVVPVNPRADVILGHVLLLALVEHDMAQYIAATQGSLCTHASCHRGPL